MLAESWPRAGGEYCKQHAARLERKRQIRNEREAPTISASNDDFPLDDLDGVHKFLVHLDRKGRADGVRIIRHLKPLPTFGGSEPSPRDGLMSWDEERILTATLDGTGGYQITISPRAEGEGE